MRVAQFARVARFLLIFAGELFSFCACTLHISCTEATCLVRRSYASHVGALHAEYRVCGLCASRAAHRENARFTFCARSLGILQVLTWDFLYEHCAFCVKIRLQSLKANLVRRINFLLALDRKNLKTHQICQKHYRWRKKQGDGYGHKSTQCKRSLSKRMKYR